MIGVIQAANQRELVEKIEGTLVASGSVGTNTAGDGTFSTASPADAFADVEAGDVLHISGVSQDYVVQSITNATTLEVLPVIAAAHTANALWKIKRGGIGVGAMLFNSPYQADGGRWIIFYDATTFGV